MTEAGRAQTAGRRTLVRGTALLMASRLGAALLGILQTILIARYFGATLSTDAFFVACGVPLLFLGVLETNLALTFTPIFIELEHEGKQQDAWTLAATLFKTGGCIVFGVSLLMFFLAQPLAVALAPGFSAQGHRELASLIRWMAPQSLIAFASAVMAALFFIRGSFVLPALTSLLAAAVPCLSVVLLHQSSGIYALPIGLLGGAALGATLLVGRLGISHPLFSSPTRITHPAVRRFGRLIVVRTLSTSLVQVNATVDRLFASCIAAGSIAQLSYAQGVVRATRQLFVVPLGRSAMPAMSRIAAQGDLAGVRSLIEGLVSALGFVIIPLFVLLVGFSDEFVRVVFARGAFDERAVQSTASALMLYALGVFSAVMNPVLTAALFAMRDSASPLKITAIGVILNVILDYLCMKAFSVGGIALATSLVSAVASVMLWMKLGRRLGGLNAAHTIGSLGRTLVAALGMVAVAKIADRTLVAYTAISLVPRLLAGIGMGSLVYAGIQAVLNRREFKQVLALLRHLVPRRFRRRSEPDLSPESQPDP